LLDSFFFFLEDGRPCPKHRDNTGMHLHRDNAFFQLLLLLQASLLHGPSPVVDGGERDLGRRGADRVARNARGRSGASKGRQQ